MQSSYAAAAVYNSANGKAAPSGGLHVAPHVVAPVIAKAPLALGYGAPYGAYGGYGGYGAYGGPGPFYG